MPKISKIDGLPVKKRNNTAHVLNKKNNMRVIKDNGTHISYNYKINTITQFALNAIDKLSPVIKKHPKFGKVAISICEKLIKTSEKL